MAYESEVGYFASTKTRRRLMPITDIAHFHACLNLCVIADSPTAMFLRYLLSMSENQALDIWSLLQISTASGLKISFENLAF